MFCPGGRRATSAGCAGALGLGFPTSNTVPRLQAASASERRERKTNEYVQKLFSWWKSKSPKKRLVHTLATAQSYEQWEEAAFELDELLSKDLWYSADKTKPMKRPS